MSVVIKRKVIYSVVVDGDTKELDEAQLKGKVKEATDRIKVLQDEIRSREKAMAECVSFIDCVDKALGIPRLGVEPNLNVSKEKIAIIKGVIEGTPSIEWSVSMLMAKSHLKESAVHFCLKYLRDMRLVHVREGQHGALFYKAKVSTPMPARSFIPTVEEAGQQDLDGLRKEEEKKRVAMRET